MTEEIYKKLAEALNARSMTYPSIPCDEFYAFAKELFTPEQAEIASSMPVNPVSAEELATKIKRADVGQLSKKLDEMAAKGLVRIKESDSKRSYEFMPLVPGIIELQFNTTTDHDEQPDNITWTSTSVKLRVQYH